MVGTVMRCALRTYRKKSKVRLRDSIQVSFPAINLLSSDNDCDGESANEVDSRRKEIGISSPTLFDFI